MSEARRTAEDLLRAATGAQQVVRVCPRCGSAAHGRPVARGSAAHVSISYADRLVAVAWSYDGPVGIDVERAGPAFDGVGDRLAWTRTEALLKASGRGVGRWPDVELPDLPVVTVGAPGLPAGFVGSVAGVGVQWRCVVLSARDGGAVSEQ